MQYYIQNDVIKEVKHLITTAVQCNYSSAVQLQQCSAATASAARITRKKLDQ